LIEYLDDYISGEKFANSTDIVFGNEICEISNAHTKTIDKITGSEREVSIYCRRSYNSTLEQILKISGYHGDITLINHNSDENPTHKPGFAKRYMTQNVGYKSDEIISIPIGLENKYNFPEINKIGKMRDKLQESKNETEWVYINHNIYTNYSERSHIYELFEGQNGFILDRGQNGQYFESYLDKIYNHRFVICPMGNGIDTHRTWECLYMGTIPIEKRNTNNIQYEGKLPIMFVDEWSEITMDLLESEYERIKKSEWQMEMLKFEYWNKMIKGI
jgi:hypothetical protein